MASLSIYVCLIIFVTICHLSQAQNSPQDYLNAHNTARSQVGIGGMQWSDDIANYAQNSVNKLKGNCQLVHSSGPYGENLAWRTGDMIGTWAVNVWVSEKSNYDYNSNQCVCASKGVWRNSVRLGCAKVRYNRGGTIISCNYDPNGNNGQRPYERPL